MTRLATPAAIRWLGSAALLGIVAASVLWLSVPSFLFVAMPAAVAESGWYSLPEGRSEALYHALVGVTTLAGGLLPAVLFFLLARRVERDSDRARRILPWSAAVLAVLSACWYIMGWGYGMRYQGAVFLWLNLALSAGIVFALAALAACWRTWRGPALPMLFLWFEFAWVFACAFPWLGETF